MNANQFLNELSDQTVSRFSKQSGKSEAEIEKMIDDLKKSIGRSVNKSSDPSKFFAILTNVLKSKLGLPGSKGGRTA